MRVLLLVSAFDGLSQRMWCALREAGHDAGVLLADAPDTAGGVRAARPDLIVCPLPRGPVPAEVRRHRRTVVIHPGPVGERAPLQQVVLAGMPSWAVTAVRADDEDAVWATRTFAVPAAPPRRSSLHHGPVADAAMECLREILVKAADPSFTPEPAGRMPAEGGAAARGPAEPFDWTLPTERIVRHVRAADGAPGVRTEVAGLPVFAYDAHPGLPRPPRPGALLSRRQGAVLVGTGDGAVWLGHLRHADEGAIKLPATTLLGRRLRDVPHSPLPPGGEPEAPSAYRQIRYRRTGAIGWLAFDFYNGAMATGHCRRLLTALRHATAQDTDVLVLRGGTDAFSNGIHLTVIEAAADPAATAWANVRAMNEVCKEIIGCTRQVVVAAYAGSAAGGGAMLGLGADVVAARAGIVLNPYYGLGLYGSELHTWTLPRRVGADAAQRLIDDRLPVGAEQAASLGLVDEVGPRHPGEYTEWLTALAESHARPRDARARRSAKARRLAAERVPLDVYEARELAETSRDVFGDRSGFAAARHAFVTGRTARSTPERLLLTAPGSPPAAPVTRTRETGADDRGPTVRPPVPVSA